MQAGGKVQVLRQEQDESGDLRNRMKVLMSKFNTIKREKEVLQKEN
jgi:hypothetical protein